MKAEKSNKLAITLRRSVIGHPKKQKAIVRGLGLRRLQHTVVHQNSPQIRGMIKKISHLVQVKDI